ncbi:copper resistance CopC family protein [Aeromicrobium sp. A1-2]|uniref:copper resistance CopC family protein n=1 Tax=Aeromicrobium sp. A1-2 TaxID=2107713 RepID=UPI0013C2ECF2|nr:copper resistance CopC family protein [Aeromicrobium sp. A1-2]
MRVSRPGRAIMACASLLAACFMWASPASAHSSLVRSSPAEGAVLPTAPRSITLEFNEKVSKIAPAIVLRNDAEAVISSRPPTVGRTTISSTVPTGLPDGSYSIVWRVVSDDGHPIQGVIRFVIGHASDPVDANEVDAPENSTSRSWTWLPVAAAVLAALIGAALVLRRYNTNHTP